MRYRPKPCTLALVSAALCVALCACEAPSRMAATNTGAEGAPIESQQVATAPMTASPSPTDLPTPTPSPAPTPAVEVSAPPTAEAILDEQPAPSESPLPDATVAEMTDALSTPSLPLGIFDASTDLTMLVEGQIYALQTNVAPLLAALGDDFKLAETPSVLHEGLEKSYTYKGIAIYTHPFEGQDIIDEIAVTGKPFSTQKGVSVGSSREDVIAAYGDGFFEEGNFMAFTESGDPDDFSSPRLVFEFDVGTVEAIYIEGMSEIN